MACRLPYFVSSYEGDTNRDSKDITDKPLASSKADGTSNSEDHPSLPRSNTFSSRSKPVDQAFPVPRSGTEAKPIPKPRPRSLVEQGPSNEPESVESSQRPVAPPRAKSKPSGANKASKPEPPCGSDLDIPPPVKSKPKLLRSELFHKQCTSVSEDRNDSHNDEEVASKDISRDGSLIHSSKKARPPPVPRRTDLE